MGINDFFAWRRRKNRFSSTSGELTCEMCKLMFLIIESLSLIYIKYNSFELFTLKKIIFKMLLPEFLHYYVLRAFRKKVKCGSLL